jgi:hypothetical protein
LLTQEKGKKFAAPLEVDPFLLSLLALPLPDWLGKPAGRPVIT